jgi:hypothetical protein
MAIELNYPYLSLSYISLFSNYGPNFIEDFKDPSAEIYQ